jgi:putative ATPase
MILWGPPGCGKTTLARIFASHTHCHFVHFSAVLSGVKEIRSVIEDAKNQQKLFRKKTVLFVDEIHRFNKAQQDAFLHHVESGLITLIGATTENPSFEVISPLLSRCRVITLNSLSDEDIAAIMRNALKDKERGLGDMNLIFDEDALSHLVRMSDGDARTALNSLESTASLIASSREETSKENPLNITLQDVERAMERKALLYDKTGDEHYNLISAFHKSLRGSDPDAATYWLGRMLSAGEDPLYIARRMVRFASEDIGNADPHAIGVSLSAMEAFRFLGHPEGDLALVQAAVYLATAPKSNSIYAAYGAVKTVIDKHGALPVPLHIRNAPTALMREIGYGKDYKYAHDYKDAYVSQDYLPEKLEGRYFYKPTDRGYENRIKQWLEKWRRLKQKEKDAKNNQK